MDEGDEASATPTGPPGAPAALDLLGPALVRAGDGTVRELTLRQERVAAVLAAAGTWVSRDELVEEAWSDRAAGRPVGRSTPAETVRSLRRRLGCTPRDRLVESGQFGYRLRRIPERLDLAAFEEAVRRSVGARQGGDWQAVVAAAHDALTLWRGVPFGRVSQLGIERVDRAGRRLQQQRASLVTDLVRGVEAAGPGSRDVALLVAHVAATVAEAPDDEYAVVLLARLHDALGEPILGLEATAALRARLAGSGEQPAETVRDLERRMRARARERVAIRVTGDSNPEVLLGQARALFADGDHDGALEVAEATVRRLEGRRALDGDDGRRRSALLAQAWLLALRAAEILGDGTRLREASVSTVVHALRAGDDDALALALRHSAWVRSPGEPNRPLADLLRSTAAGASGSVLPTPRRAAILAAGRSVHDPTESSATPSSRAERLALTEHAITYGRAHGDDLVLSLGLWCRLAVASGGPDLVDQLAVQHEAQRLATTDLEELGLRLYRVPLRLAAGDLAGLADDTARLRELGALTGSAEAVGVAAQVEACLAMAVGDAERAGAAIQEGATRLRGQLIHQEVAAVQRWWLTLDDPPPALLTEVGVEAARGLRPAYRVMLAYTHHRLGRSEDVRDALAGLWPAGGSFQVPEDITYPVALAAFVELAAAVGDRDRVAAALPLLLAYGDQQFVVAIGTAFVMGATGRFVGIAHAALGHREKARAFLDRALELEAGRGWHALAAATARAAARVLEP